MIRKNKIVINHIEGRVERHYVNGRIIHDAGTPSGHSGAKQMRFMGRSILVHRLIYLDFHGPIAPWMQIDHIEGKEAGNGIANLRWTNSQGNSQNRRKAHKNNKSGYLGVSWHSTMKAWIAVIMVSGKVNRLGFFQTPELAHAAYVQAKRDLHATCTI